MDLEEWASKKMKYWEVNSGGQLATKKSDTKLSLKMPELPDTVQIEAEFIWKNKLDFSFSLGVAKNSKRAKQLPRIESWDDAGRA